VPSIGGLAECLQRVAEVVHRSRSDRRSSNVDRQLGRSHCGVVPVGEDPLPVLLVAGEDERA
jgi:hypothetical protein